MNDLVKYTGIIEFDPINRTRKHNSQASWKKVAMVMMQGDITEYYAWFVKRRYNLVLNKPLRGAHISFINDSIRDINGGNGSIDEREDMWDALRSKWDGKEIEIILNVSPRTNTTHWWLNIPEEHRTELHAIRNEVGLGRPNFGLHMSIGYANENNIEHSAYIHRLIRNNLIII